MIIYRFKEKNNYIFVYVLLSVNWDNNTNLMLQIDERLQINNLLKVTKPVGYMCWEKLRIHQNITLLSLCGNICVNLCVLHNFGYFSNFP